MFGWRSSCGVSKSSQLGDACGGSCLGPGSHPQSTPTANLCALRLQAVRTRFLRGPIFQPGPRSRHGRWCCGVSGFVSQEDGSRGRSDRDHWVAMDVGGGTTACLASSQRLRRKEVPLLLGRYVFLLLACLRAGVNTPHTRRNNYKSLSDVALEVPSVVEAPVLEAPAGAPRGCFVGRPSHVPGKPKFQVPPTPGTARNARNLDR